MKTLLFFLQLFYFFSVYAQTNNHELVSTSGSTFKNNNYVIDYSIGEVMIESFNEKIIMTQGFHQNTIIIFNNIDEIYPKIKVYPNPTKSFFTLELNQRLSVNSVLTDKNGKVIFKNYISDDIKKTFDITMLTQGIYFFTVTDNNQNISSFKIIKL
tara:strand:- start:466 stop:933 length:468 start_codon:yes stop_codon:yes gene_type:complete